MITKYPYILLLVTILNGMVEIQISVGDLHGLSEISFRKLLQHIHFFKKQSRLCIFNGEVTCLMMMLDTYTVRVSLVGAGSTKVMYNN